MNNGVQPALDKQQEATRPRWTGRKRDPERFRARILSHLRGQAREWYRHYNPTDRQIAWEAWHILKHLWAGETFCYECAHFIPAPLFPAPIVNTFKGVPSNGAFVDRMATGGTVVPTEKVGRNSIPEKAARARKHAP